MTRFYAQIWNVVSYSWLIGNRLASYIAENFRERLDFFCIVRFNLIKSHKDFTSMVSYLI